MSSSGSYDSLLCPSPSDSKNFSSSIDDASKFTSTNSLNIIATNDPPVDESCKMEDHETPAQSDNTADAVADLGSGESRKKEIESSSEVTIKMEEGSETEPQNVKGECSEPAKVSGSISSGRKTNNRKRLREKVEEDEDDDDDEADENAGEVLHKRLKGDPMLEPRDPDEPEEAPEGEAADEVDPMIDFDWHESLSSDDLHSSPLSSDSDSDDSVDIFEDLFFHRSPFMARLFGLSKKSRRIQEEEEKKVFEDLPTKFHYKLLKLARERETGHAPRILNGYKAYQEAIIRDVDIVRKFGLIHRYEEHNECVNCLHFNDAGNLIASGSDDMSVVVYDWIMQKVNLSFATHHKENVYQTKFMPHSLDSHIVTCARDGVVGIAQLSTTGSCRSHKKLATHKGAAHKLALILDNPHEFYSCGEDGVTHQIDLRIGKPSMSFITKHRNKEVVLYSIHANPMKNQEICVVGRDPFVRIYDIRNINKNKEDATLNKFCPPNLRFGQKHITAAVYNYNGSEIVASYNAEDIYLFNSSFSDEAGHISRYKGRKNSATVKGVNFYGAKSEYVVSGSDCGNIFIWDKGTTELVNIFHGDDAGVVNVIENHPTLPLIATSGLDSDVKLWSPDKNPVSDLKRFNLEKRRRSRPKNQSFYAEFDNDRLLVFLTRALRRNAVEIGLSSDSSSDAAVVTDDDEEDEDNNDGANGEDDDDGANGEDDDDGANGEDDDDGDDTGRQNIQCAS